MGLFGVGFLPDVDKGDQRDDAPGDLQNEGEPAVFGVEADSHQDRGNEIEELVKDAVFQDVER